MNSYIRNRCHGSNRCRREKDCRARHFCDLNVQLRHLRAAHRDRDSVSAGITRFGSESWMIRVLDSRVIVVVGYCRMMVLV